MKIAILARNPHLYSHQRLLEAGKARGHEMRIINTLSCYINISSPKPEVRYRGGEILDKFDAIIPRIGASVTFYGAAVVRQFEMMDVYAVNASLGISRSRDKLHSLQLLAQNGINLPITGFAHSPSDTEDLIEMVGGPPLIIKLLEGTQGIGVMLTETHRTAKSVVNAFKGLKADILVQEYIAEAGGSDIRCFVIGDQVVAAMQRQAKEEEFRSNIHRGGKATIITITDEERTMAIQAARIMGLNVAGVDLIRSKRGSMVLEVNSSPGLEGIEMATSEDIASKIIAFIEEEVGKKLAYPVAT